MQRSISQFRPKGDPEAFSYSPQRDLANIYLPMLREAFVGLEEENWDSETRERFAAAGVLNEDLGEAVTAFMEVHRLFIREQTVKTIQDAIDQAGLMRVSPAAREAIFARLGQVAMGGWFIAVRDVTAQGSKSPVHTDFMEMLATGRAMAAKLSGRDLREVPTSEELALELVTEDLREQERIAAQQTRRLSDLQSQVVELQSAKYSLQSQLAATQAALQEAQQQSRSVVAEVVTAISALPPGWRRLRLILPLLWRRYMEPQDG